jgi:uracil-DNA glycosylase family 4
MPLARPNDEPPSDCGRCARLAAFRQQKQTAEPAWHNAPVAGFGVRTAPLLIVGLAPGLKGANRTGRPFTGDFAGDLLYATLLEFGLASGVYAASPDDGLTLRDCRITNAVRCVPPQNKPLPAEIATCRSFLSATILGMPHLKAILVLGRIAHDSTLTALDKRKSLYPFAHRARHDVGPGLALFDSYHCSRYNTNTGVLTPDMFRAVFSDIRTWLGKSKGAV